MTTLSVVTLHLPSAKSPSLTSASYPERDSDLRATPPVSIGLPVYNGGDFLGESIHSILSQTFSDFELIVSDNGSTDTTPDIIADAVARDERVVWLRSATNRGGAWNFNRVFRAARGRYFRWAAHDDIVHPAYLERLVGRLEDSPKSVVLVQSDTLLVGPSGESLGPREESDALSSPRASTRLWHLVRSIELGNLIFGLTKREALTRTRLLGAYPSSDYVLLAELALLGEFSIVHEGLFMRRIHPGMSRQANVTLEEVTTWYDPAAERVVQGEMLNLFAEHLRGIHSSAISPRAKGIVYPCFVTAWLSRRARAMASEALRLAKNRAG